MNFKKIRQILIILLVCVNLFMIMNFANLVYKDYKINQKMIRNNSEILNQKGIFLEEELLSYHNKDIKTFYYETYLTDDLVTKIIGEISSNENNLYIGSSGTAKLNSDGSFTISLTGEYTFLQIEKVLIEAGLEFENLDREINENIATYTLKTYDNYVSDVSFDVILNDSNAHITGNFVFNNFRVQKVKLDKSPFEILIQTYNKIGAFGQINNIELQYILRQEEVPSLVPVLYFSGEYISFLYDINQKNVIAYTK